MNIMLIGYRGSGKTTVGRMLADRLGYGFFDNDDQITKTAGQTIKEIFEKHGQEHFRQLETRALAHIAGLDKHVISLGGGVILREVNRHRITGGGHHVIYLHADPEELFRRIRSDPATAANRPNLTSLVGGLDEIRSVLAEREPIYRQVMTLELDVTKLSTQQVVAAIVKML
jgi:shikimate kinase